MVAVLATILGVFVAGVLVTVERIRRDVAKHDKADAVLLQRVTSLEKSLDEFKGETRESLAALNNKADQILIALAQRQAA